MINEKYSQRRHPVHHTPVERFNEPVIVQVNVCTKDRCPILACDAGHRLCREVWSGADFWRVGQYMIMPDHIHLFCTPGRRPMPSLKNWVEYWKAQIAFRWAVNNGNGGSASMRTAETDGMEPVPPREQHGGSASVRTSCFKLWQRDFWDTQMRSRTQYEEKLAYVRMNPVRKELVNRVENWPYQGEVFPLVWM